MGEHVSVGGTWYTKEEYTKMMADKAEKIVKKIKKEETKPDIKFDITGDGKVDKEDASLAGKVLANAAKQSTTNSNSKDEKSKGGSNASGKSRRKVVPSKRTGSSKE